jgi:ABC-type transporter Mla subunit MlaD
MDHYRGHESKPTAAYLRDLEVRTGGAPAAPDDPFAKINAMIDDGNRVADDLLAKIADATATLAEISAGTAEMSADIERLEASANPFSDQHGRPENMAPAKWLALRAKP